MAVFSVGGSSRLIFFGVKFSFSLRVRNLFDTIVDSFAIVGEAVTAAHVAKEKERLNLVFTLS